MRKHFCLLSMLFVCLSATPQAAVVTDPTSMAQRISIFLEQMEEAVSQGVDLAESSESIKNLFQLTEQSVEDLKKVSSFIKCSRQFADITEAEIRIAGKVEDYSERIKELNSLSYNEKLNIISSIVTLGGAAMERIKNGIDLVKNSSSDAKLSDYERLQILSDIEDEVLALEDAIDDAYDTSLSDETRDCILATLTNMSLRALTFNF